MLPVSAREHREDTVDHDDKDDARHHRAGRCETHRGCASTGLQAAMAADRRDRQAEDGRLGDAECQVPGCHRATQVGVELQPADIKARRSGRSTRRKAGKGARKRPTGRMQNRYAH